MTSSGDARLNYLLNAGVNKAAIKSGVAGNTATQLVQATVAKYCCSLVMLDSPAKMEMVNRKE